MGQCRGQHDSDADGLPDWYEFVIGTSPSYADSDGDGIPMVRGAPWFESRGR